MAPIAIILKDSRYLKSLKSELEAKNLLNKARKIEKKADEFVIYTTLQQPPPKESGSVAADMNEISSFLATIPEYTIETYESPQTEHNTNVEPSNPIAACFKRYCSIHDISHTTTPALASQLPKKWSIYPPMVLFTSNTFDTESRWQTDEKLQGFFPYLLAEVFPGISHIAVNKPIIESDVMRRPFNLVPVYGDFGPEPTEQLYSEPTTDDFDQAFWCSVVQNGITQFWAPRYTMFSRGNIKEKKRVLDTFPVARKDVVLDLYGGIGYFTFSYLKKGAVVFAWELNRWSIEGLKRGMTANGFKYKEVTGENEVEGELDAASYQREMGAGTTAFIFNESNERAIERLKGLAQRLPVKHINLGLLPSSKDSWEMCSRIIQDYSAADGEEYRRMKNEPPYSSAQQPVGKGRSTAVNTATTSSEDNGTYIHVHENVSIHDFDMFCQETLNFFSQHGETKLLHLEKVKTFAPDIWHVVVDYKSYPKSPSRR